MTELKSAPALLCHRAVGPMTLQSISSAYCRWVDDDRFDPFVPILWDCRGHPIEMSTKDLIDIPRFTNGLTGKRRAGLRTAILVSDYVMRYVAETVAGNAAWVAEVRVFDAEERAVDWLLHGAPVC